MPTVANRRRRRSDNPLVALHYQLTYVRHECQLDAIVVSDDSGIVVAGAGDSAKCEELAAYAPLLAQGLGSEPEVDPDWHMPSLGSEVGVQRVDLDGHTVLLCASGRWTRPGARKLAAEGVARILSASHASSPGGSASAPRA